MIYTNLTVSGSSRELSELGKNKKVAQMGTRKKINFAFIPKAQYTNKRFMNNMKSSCHVQSYPNDTDDEDVDDEQAKLTSPESLTMDMCAMNGNRPKIKVGNIKSSTAFPMIPKELYEAFPNEVKVITKQQHAYYINKYGRGGSRYQSPTRHLCLPDHHSINNAMTIPASDDQYNDTSE